MTVAFTYLQLALAFSICLCAVYGARQTICSPLNSVPGPFAAKFTNLWQAFLYYRGKQYSTVRELHDRYGAAVRLGPKHVSLNDSSLIKKIYSLKGDYIKVRLLSYPSPWASTNPSSIEQTISGCGFSYPCPV